MDITKELLNLKKENISNVLDILRKEQLISEQKTYLFEVMQLTMQIKDLSPELISVGCDTIQMINVSDANRQYSIELSPKRSKGLLSMEVRNYKGNFLPWFQNLINIYPKFKIDINNTNNFKKINIDLNSDIESQIYSNLLSNELSAIFNYADFNLNINSKKSAISKPKKI